LSDTAIFIDGLSKRYQIGAKQESYRTLRDLVVDTFSAPYRRLRLKLKQLSSDSSSPDTVWALADVSFEVKRGEVIGVIGRNGAGKSTLLKILSRVTEPTRGYAEVRGRVGSLLEVGTGFHPELTGRENIFLNGAILGMRRAEIQAKFDEIVQFSGIERFIDTPVKFYSSGMYLRLAFAVAAHFEPEVLLVDEVLAVGDLEFQKKCLGRMSKVAKEGRTVLFVSHNLTAISSLTSRCVLLDEGRVKMFGDTEETISAYHAAIINAQQSLEDRSDRSGTGQIRFTAIELLDPATSEPVSSVYSGNSLLVRLYWRSREPLTANETAMDIRVNDSLGVPLVSFSTRFEPWQLPRELGESGCAECVIPCLPLAADDYTLDLWAGVRGRQSDYLGNAASLAVRNVDYFGTGQMPSIRKHGGFLVRHNWSLTDPPHASQPN
jgi:lipopolysaccharide transport system ATP-binding protein